MDLNINRLVVRASDGMEAGFIERSFDENGYRIWDGYCYTTRGAQWCHSRCNHPEELIKSILYAFAQDRRLSWRLLEEYTTQNSRVDVETVPISLQASSFN